MSLPWLSLIPMSAVMLLGWWWQCRHRNAAIVDALWASLMGAAGLYYALVGDSDWPLRLFVGLLMPVWYWRIAWHLWQRLKSEGEDGRYRYLRNHWGGRANTYHFFFFQLQAGFAWGFTLPAWFVSFGNGPWAVWQLVLAVLLVMVAWAGESLADHQLAAFKRDPDNRGGVCQRGLWRYSRHPNYFFEWLQWFVWPLLAWQFSDGLWMLLAPLVMLLFLYFLTGIPFSEQQSLRTRGEAYREYQRTTSPFIPWRPKR
ncbi:MAG: DUF1295 domain-containing protein [Pseudomonadota bacterium]